MAGAVEMLGRVLILRRIAAADVPAGQAGAKMHPGVAHGDALRAEMRRRRGITAVGEVFAASHRGTPERRLDVGVAEKLCADDIK